MGWEEQEGARSSIRDILLCDNKQEQQGGSEGENIYNKIKLQVGDCWLPG